MNMAIPTARPSLAIGIERASSLAAPGPREPTLVAMVTEEDACAPDPWIRCGGWIAAALARSGGSWTLDDAKAAVTRGEMVLWAAERCAFLTHVVQTPRMAVFDVVAAGGALDAILELVPALIEAARRMGCGRITAAGRSGWLRALENTGLTDAWVVVAKDL